MDLTSEASSANRTEPVLAEDLAWRVVRGDGYNAHIGPMHIARAGENCWFVTLIIDARHINVGGVCHGGVIMSLADVAMGAAAFEAEDGHQCATLEMNTHFLSAGKVGAMLIAKAQRNRGVRGLSFMDCEIWSDGRQIARAAGIWKHLASKAPGTGNGP